MTQGLMLASAGVVVGLVGALGLNRLLTSLLFGVQPADVTTLAIVIPSIIVIAALACWLPAWRASRLDPNVVLRADESINYRGAGAIYTLPAYAVLPSQPDVRRGADDCTHVLRLKSSSPGRMFFLLTKP